MSPFSGFFGQLAVVWAIVANTWWMWVPLVMFLVALAVWLHYRVINFKKDARWVMFEIRSPREVVKSPKTMEQFFANLYTMRNAPANWYEKYWDGEIPLWHALEITGDGGNIRFFLRSPREYEKIVVAHLHACYPDCDITEVPDYIQAYPSTLAGLYKAGYKLWASELRLEKEDAYPIRTYVEFESEAEEQNLDPIASLMELMGKLHAREHIWVQMLVRPDERGELHAMGQKLADQFKKESTTTITGAEGTSSEMFIPRTPGELEKMKAIERNIAKPGFHTLIRILYFAPPDIYNAQIGRRGIISAFRQYTSMSLNAFQHNYYVWTEVKWHFYPWIFPTRRREARRRALWDDYRRREMPEEYLLSRIAEWNPFRFGALHTTTFLLNTEELATIFHLPTMEVATAPLMKKVESRRVGPPLGLDIFKEEEAEPGAAELPPEETGPIKHSSISRDDRG